MLIDVHSHFFRSPEHFSKDFAEQAKRVAGSGAGLNLNVRWEDYHAQAQECDWTVVFGGKAALSGLWVPDDEVAEYTKSHADKTIGFLSLDPTRPGWEDELHHGHQDLKLKGIKLMPMYAGFYPNERKLDYLWEYATLHHLPVLLHTVTTFVSQAPINCTFPRHVDDLAIRFPQVKIIMAHLSHPFEGECVAVIRKHPNVYADCSAIYYRPLQNYHSLMLVQEYRVWGKVLFGSDYPFATVDASLDGMRKLNQMLDGTALPRLDMEQMEAMFQRNSFELLGIEI
jgi:predicted TIM-barrel fold metal-dependent hydrolase